MKIALVANSSWYLFNFRSSTIKKFIDKGHEVIVISPSDGYEKKLIFMGASFKNWNISAKNLNVLLEIISIFNLFFILKKNKIDMVLSFTPKGNIYSGLISRILQIKFIPNISGLGKGFVESSYLKIFFFKRLYKYSLKKASFVLFQNNEDMRLFKNSSLLQGSFERIPGSGVDLEKFKSFSNKEKSCSSFLLATRLLRSKGVLEYIEAAKNISKSYSNITFNILGFLDSDHPDGVPKKLIFDLSKETSINFLGQTENIIDFLKITDCVVLPSYYNEGVPKILLEAASMKIPVITTNHPGCRDAVNDEVSGLLCEPKNSNDLEDKMLKIINMSSKKLFDMGQAGRIKMEKEFDEKIILDKYLELIKA